MKSTMLTGGVTGLAPGLNPSGKVFKDMVPRNLKLALREAQRDDLAYAY